MSALEIRAAAFSASLATWDPGRACNAAQDGTLTLSKAAIRQTQMMKAGDTFLYVRCVTVSSKRYTTAVRRHMTAPQHWIELRRTLVFGTGVLPYSHRFLNRGS
jgi:hypothetical protein